MELKYNFNKNHGYTSYIINKNLSSNSTGYLVPILFSPDNYSENLSSTYDQQNIPGRSAPVISYSYTGARQVNVSFNVYADHLPQGYYNLSTYINAIKALEYPNYSNGIVTAPSSQLNLPGLSIDGVCSSVSIEYKTDRFKNNSPTAAVISLTFIEVLETIKGAINIINGGDSRAIETSTSSVFKNFVDESNSSLERKLILNGYGVNQSTSIDYDCSRGGTSSYGPNVSTALMKSYSKSDSVKKIIITVYDATAGKTLTSDDLSWFITNEQGTGPANYFDILNDTHNYYSLLFTYIGQYVIKKYKGKYVNIQIVYTPKDANGNTYSDYICRRYYRMKG